jgi:hypothetical protein
MDGVSYDGTEETGHVDDHARLSIDRGGNQHVRINGIRCGGTDGIIQQSCVNTLWGGPSLGGALQMETYSSDVKTVQPPHVTTSSLAPAHTPPGPQQDPAHSQHYPKVPGPPAAIPAPERSGGVQL